MRRLPLFPQSGGTGSSDAQARGRKNRRLDGPQLGLAIVLGFVGFVALVVGIDQLTSSPAMCGACHEMKPRVAAWEVSPHANVKCVSCHVANHPWYEFAQTLMGRGKLISKNVAAHVKDPSQGPVDVRPAGTPAMPDSICLQCHDPNRKPTAGLGILIDHAKHAKRNGSCVSCHITVAHPKPTRGTALSFMGQCFTCHGTSKTAKAPATCSLCHPADFKLLPSSHNVSTWQRKQHGKVALADRQECYMCHTQQFCDTKCHGLRMPHPKDWQQSTGHPAAARRDRTVCTRCHTGKPDFCTMCHHKAYNPSAGTWVQQHFLEVRKKGAGFCLDCHSPVFCAKCHVEGAPPPSG